MDASSNDAILKEIRDLKESMNFMSDKFDSCMKELMEAKKEKEILNKTVTTMGEKIQMLEGKVNELTNSLLSENLEVAGIPCKPEEVCTDIALKVTRKVYPGIKPGDIKDTYRLGNPKTKDGNVKLNRPLLIKFNSAKTRNIVFKNKKNLKDIDTMEMGLTAEKKRVFINEHLSAQTKSLFWLTNKTRKEQNWKFIWTNNGTIYARKNENSEVKIIKSKVDLELIK